MKTLGVCLLVALTIPVAASAVSGFNEQPRLEAAASSVAGKPVAVMCADTATDWRDWLVENGVATEANGTADTGGTTMRLSPDACQYLRDRQRGREGTLYSVGASILVLTHEAIHLRGEHDEGVTDCAASREMVAVARRFFGFKKRAVLRALMVQVARVRAREAPAYRAVC